MKTKSRSQAGEGKLGCIVSLAVLAVLGAVAYKIGPPYLHRNELKSLSEDLASRAGIMRTEIITKQLRAKALELEIPEAQAPGAIEVRAGDSHASEMREGTCTIHLNYTQKIDFYGITSMDFVTDETISKPYMDAR